MNHLPLPSESSAAYLTRLAHEAGNTAAAHTCPLCQCARSAPHRREDDEGKITEGCVSSWHTGWVAGKDKDWHHRPSAVAIRAMAAHHHAFIVAGVTPIATITTKRMESLRRECESLAALPEHRTPGWRPVVVMGVTGRKRPFFAVCYRPGALGDRVELDGFEKAQIVAVV